MKLHNYRFGFSVVFAAAGYTSTLEAHLFNTSAEVADDLEDQGFGVNGFDYETCSYDAQADVCIGDLCAALDLTALDQKCTNALAQKESHLQFAELIYQEFCRPIERELGCKPSESIAAFSKAYAGCYKAFSNSATCMGAVPQLIRAAHALDCYGKDADLLGLLGAQNFAALKGLQALAIEHALLWQARKSRFLIK